ncbi:unnamed protein product [Lepeophtheirus salmonis]|uniref:(salmon louse) hypothetical protein n=1 Tax=Lepeophtheirus salmonis TaxID=72036 RepID=A0A7R8CRP6_LEPSM|nr:unnamed protein product [Lepeophtheirus salmonis]CAF2858525.1 unnamed protein product [Lepeophtheirus salmonis]
MRRLISNQGSIFNHHLRREVRSNDYPRRVMRKLGVITRSFIFSGLYTREMFNKRRISSSISVDGLHEKDLYYYFNCCSQQQFSDPCQGCSFESDNYNDYSTTYSDISSQNCYCPTCSTCLSPSPPQGFYTTFPPLPGPIPFRSRPLGSIEKVLEYRPLLLLPLQALSLLGVALN